MAISENPIHKDKRGHINKTIVFKQYHKTVVTIYPDMSKVVFTKEQRDAQKCFKQAVEYAKAICADPVKKAEYSKRMQPGQKVYNAIIAEFMRKT
jgi:hypothetical protein